MSSTFEDGFFDSCKDVQFGTANLLAMSLVGGGAKDATASLKYLGDEKPLGGPFQINVPQILPSPPLEQFIPQPRNCANSDLGSRCTCIDRPNVCPVLPEVPPPEAGPSCRVGAVSCLTFILMDVRFTGPRFRCGSHTQLHISASPRTEIRKSSPGGWQRLRQPVVSTILFS